MRLLSLCAPSVAAFVRTERKSEVRNSRPQRSCGGASTHPPLTVWDISNTYSARLFLILTQLFTYFKKNNMHTIKKWCAKAQIPRKVGECQCSLHGTLVELFCNFLKGNEKVIYFISHICFRDRAQLEYSAVLNRCIFLHLERKKRGEGSSYLCAACAEKSHNSLSILENSPLLSPRLKKSVSSSHSVAVCQGSVTPFLFLDPPSFQGVFSPLLSSLLRSELM